MRNRPTRHSPVFRYRALTPAQEVAVKHSHAEGAKARDLAEAYGVGVRSIYRALHRAERPRHEVTIGEHRAVFEIEDGAPIQVTPWVPA